MAACSKGHKEVVKLLVEKGADVNKASKTGNTPLLVFFFFFFSCWDVGVIFFSPAGA